MCGSTTGAVLSTAPKPPAVLMLILLNQHAGTHSEDHANLPAKLHAAFAAHGQPSVEILWLDGHELPDSLRAIAGRLPSALVVGGGDGTISGAAATLADSGVPLGIIPLGTLNHFAKDAGVPLELREAVGAIVRGRTRDVDIGEVNGRTFINTCSLGGYTEALRRREILRRRDGHAKWRAMLVGVLAALRRVPRLDVEMRSAAWQARLHASFVLVANNRYHDDAVISGRRERLDAGQLWVYTTRAHRWRDLGRAALEALSSGLHQASALKSWSTDSFTLECAEAPLRVAIDGEIVRLESPLRFRTRPRALRIFVP
jgi:diacylglycerol kinase family enzyme